MKTFHFEVDSDGLALIRIDTPGRPVNLVDDGFIDELNQCMDRVAAEPAIRGLLLCSGKPGSFVAGADIRSLLRQADDGATPQQAAAWVRRIALAYRRVETCGKPVVAALNGLALGGGLELALACHHRVLADDARCVVGLPEVTLGLLPGAGGTQRLPRLIGIDRALPLLLEGRKLAPAEALALGVVDRLAPPDRLIDTAREHLLTQPRAEAPWDRKGFSLPGGHAHPFSTTIAGVLRQGGPRQAASLAILSSVYEGCLAGFEAGLRIESKYFGTLLAGPQARELMRGFLNRH